MGSRLSVKLPRDFALREQWNSEGEKLTNRTNGGKPFRFPLVPGGVCGYSTHRCPEQQKGEPMRSLVLTAAVSALALSACGGAGVEVDNRMSTPITDVTLSCGEAESSWERIGVGQTVKSSMTLEPQSTMTLSFMQNGRLRTESVRLPRERTDSPEGVWIGIYGDRLSLEYAY